MKFFLKIFLLLFVIASLGLTIYGVYRFQQSSMFMKRGNQALLQGKIHEAKEYYDKAHDAFPYRPAASKVLEGLNIFNETNETYSTKVPQEPPTGTPSPQPTGLPLREVKVPILMYHHIQTNPLPLNLTWAALFVSPKQLNDQLEYLNSHNYHTVTLDDVTSALDGKTILPPNPVVLTFDDGYQSFYDNAYPLLKKYNMKGINFIITDVVGSGVYLTWNEIKTMDKSGLVSFGAHTKHHPFLTAISNILAKEEISGSKTELEKQLKKPIKWFAYPYGDYNKQIIDLVKTAGYTGAVTTVFGSLQTKDTLFIMPRVMVDGRYTIEKIASTLQK